MNLQGGSRISGKGVHMYKGAGFFLLILSHFSKISYENEIICLTESKLFNFHRIFKN